VLFTRCQKFIDTNPATRGKFNANPLRLVPKMLAEIFADFD
jgi:hypothetical protein